MTASTAVYHGHQARIIFNRSKYGATPYRMDTLTLRRNLTRYCTNEDAALDAFFDAVDAALDAERRAYGARKGR
jgi:hypothetical protein